MYEIEDGVPLLPDARGRALGGGSSALYPWDTMKVGQSFFVPETKAKQIGLSSCASTWSCRHGGKVKFATRKCEKDGVPGTRVWRIE